MRRLFVFSAALVCAIHGNAQQSLGSVKTQGNEVSGLVRVSNGNAVIGNSAAVAAGVQPAEVTLSRGGSVRICSGSAAHLAQTNIAVAKRPMMMALDRGAVEIRTSAEKTDSILTPDLRFELSDAAPLDLRIRIVPNGDTCVDNAGKNAPILHVTETFGDGTYFVRPGQRVLFEHGSLREVVDHESSSCGCPRPDDLVLAGKGKMGDGKVTDEAKAHPFPEAVSQGLQQPEPPQPAPVGETHTRVNSTLAYNGTTNTVTGPPGETTTATDAATPVVPATTAPNAATTAPTIVTSPPPPATNVHVESMKPPEQGPNPFRAIGHFFRKLFGVHD